jgi:hypothetical protein
MTDLTEFFGEPIAVYSMEQALADGVLVDAGALAADLFTWRVLLTQAVHADCVSWTDADGETTGAHGQSETGRLWDVLWMTFVALRHLPRDANPGSPVAVPMYRISREAPSAVEPAPELVTLKAMVGIGDDGEPVLVIGFPEED